MPYLIEFERAHTSERAVTVRILDPAADDSFGKIIAETTFVEGLPYGIELKADALLSALTITAKPHATEKAKP